MIPEATIELASLEFIDHEKTLVSNCNMISLNFSPLVRILGLIFCVDIVFVSDVGYNLVHVSYMVL